MSITARCDDDGVAGLLADRLGPLAVDDPAAGPSGPTLEVEVRGPGRSPDPGWPAVPAGPGRPVYDAPAGPIDYFEESDQLFVEYDGTVRLRCDPTGGRIELAVVGSDPVGPVLATQPLLTIALLESMKRFGRSPLHAGAVARQGRGLLLAGASGAGKSTLTVAMVRAGLDFLTDDMVFLHPAGGGVTASGLPDPVDVTPSTVELIPELGHLAGLPFRPGRDKHGVRLEEALGATLVPSCSPVAVVSPRVVPGARPELTVLPPAEALFELAPNLLLTEPVATQAHLDALADLVRTVPCYTFRLGADLAAAASCLAGLLDR